MSTRYRRRAREIEAMRYPGPGAEPGTLIAVEDWLEPVARGLGRWPLRYKDQALLIPTLMGDIAAMPGDWILRGAAGELAVASPSLFARDFEPVEPD